MIYIIIIAIIAYLIYLSIKGNADLQNVKKHGGLQKKYNILIQQIMQRNSLYQLNELNANNVELTNTGMKFKLIEIDKQLQITWYWDSFVSGKTHKLVWKFNENEDQIEMYKIIKKDMAIQNLVDDGMTKQQAKDFYAITSENNKDVQDKLAESFSRKYPDLWSKIMGE